MNISVSAFALENLVPRDEFDSPVGALDPESYRQIRYYTVALTSNVLFDFFSLGFGQLSEEKIGKRCNLVNPRRTLAGLQSAKNQSNLTFSFGVPRIHVRKKGGRVHRHVLR